MYMWCWAGSAHQGVRTEGEPLPAKRWGGAQERQPGVEEKQDAVRTVGWVGGSETHELVQWRRLRTRNAEGPGSIPGQGTGVLMPPRFTSRFKEFSQCTWHVIQIP